MSTFTVVLILVLVVIPVLFSTFLVVLLTRQTQEQKLLLSSWKDSLAKENLRLTDQNQSLLNQVRAADPMTLVTMQHATTPQQDSGSNYIPTGDDTEEYTRYAALLAEADIQVRDEDKYEQDLIDAGLRDALG